MAGKRENYDPNYDPNYDCENDAAFHIWWRLGDGRMNDLGVISWAKDKYPEKHEQLSKRFKDAVREVLGD